MSADPRKDTSCPMCRSNVSLEKEDDEKFSFRCLTCETQFDILKINDPFPQRMGPFDTLAEADAARFAADYVLNAWGSSGMSIDEVLRIGEKWFVGFSDDCNDDRVIEYRRDGKFRSLL